MFTRKAPSAPKWTPLLRSREQTTFGRLYEESTSVLSQKFLVGPPKCNTWPENNNNNQPFRPSLLLNLIHSGIILCHSYSTDEKLSRTHIFNQISFKFSGDIIRFQPLKKLKKKLFSATTKWNRLRENPYSVLGKSMKKCDTKCKRYEMDGMNNEIFTRSFQEVHQDKHQVERTLQSCIIPE